jgi:hypothetical protein
VIFQQAFFSHLTYIVMSSTGSAAASSSSLSFTTPPPIRCEKLVGAANYAGWAAAIELCFEGQCCDDHFLKQYKNIPAKDQANWTFD